MVVHIWHTVVDLGGRGRLGVLCVRVRRGVDRGSFDDRSLGPVIGSPVPRGCLITDGAVGATDRRRRLKLRPYRAARWCGSAVGNRMPRTAADVPLAGELSPLPLRWSGLARLLGFALVWFLGGVPT